MLGRCVSSMSAAVLYFHLVLGLPVLPPCISTSSALLSSLSPSLLVTCCPHHLSLVSCAFFETSATRTVPLILVWLKNLNLFSTLGTPHSHRSDLISASCHGDSSRVMAPPRTLQLGLVLPYILSLSAWLASFCHTPLLTPISSFPNPLESLLIFPFLYSHLMI